MTTAPGRLFRRPGAAGSLGVDMPSVSFVVNGSLAGVSGRFVPLCREVAAGNGWTAEFHVTDKAEAGVAAARGSALDGADLVVAVGGDGTVRGCAEGVASTGVPLGIVPHGTANLLARTLGIPGHPRAALDVALDKHRPTDDRLIDLAIADREPFTAMAGMGRDAERARQQVGGAVRDGAERHAGRRHALGAAADGPVPAHRHHQVGSVEGRSPGRRDPGLGLLGDVEFGRPAVPGRDLAAERHEPPADAGQRAVDHKRDSRHITTEATRRAGPAE